MKAQISLLNVLRFCCAFGSLNLLPIIHSDHFVKTKLRVKRIVFLIAYFLIGRKVLEFFIE